MGKPTTRQECLHVRVAKRNAKLKGGEYNPTRRTSTKHRKTIAANNEIVKQLREQNEGR